MSRGRSGANRGLFYGAVLVVIVGLLGVMCRHAAGRPDLLEDGVRPDELKELADKLTPGFASYAALLALASVAPTATAFGFFATAVAGVLVLSAERRP